MFYKPPEQSDEQTRNANHKCQKDQGVQAVKFKFSMLGKVRMAIE